MMGRDEKTVAAIQGLSSSLAVEFQESVLVARRTNPKKVFVVEGRAMEQVQRILEEST